MRRVTNQAHWFFAYTERGAQAVVAGGFPPSRVTAVGNASETEDILAWRQTVTRSEVRSLRQRLDLGDGPVGIFIGALDESKGVRLLLDAGAEIVEKIPAFKLVICGDGPMREVVEARAAGTEWLSYLGRVTGREKVAIAACAQLMLIPARIGLVAVDSLALGLPLVTTTKAGHGPEFEFLEPGMTVVVVPDARTAFATAVVDLLGDDARLAEMSRRCVEAAAYRTVGDMVSAFAVGVQQALDAGR
jgi:glycosyltransferase involved in cell wall biosynthesis